MGFFHILKVLSDQDLPVWEFLSLGRGNVLTKDGQEGAYK